MNMKGKRFIIAGGGTGGHIFPAIAIANAIKKAAPDSEFLFVGAKRKMEMEKVPLAGYKIEGLTIAGFNRSSLIKNVGLPVKLIKSFFQVASILKKFKPDAVIGVGGYSSFPVLRYAQSKGIPTFIHEANSFAGKTNIMLAKKAVRIFTATDGMEMFFDKKKITVSGNPVRNAIAQMIVNRSEAIAQFKLSANKKTVLVVGGSLGAKSINEAIEKHIYFFEKYDLQLIWQTGKPFAEKAKQLCKEMNHVYISDFIAQMENAYAAADLVISRSGAMAISELCIVAKPVIFVPFPHAAENHQKANAMKLVEKEAALMVEDKDAMNELMNKVKSLIDDTQLQEKLKANIKKLGVLNADEIVAKEIINCLN
jgi:UDP-N-acetylglucosamine--N-acetylmuramyl-(pentapeptide) pyrophosphoryl-undecaprenol N-acetylglucosamine transferase